MMRTLSFGAVIALAACISPACQAEKPAVLALDPNDDLSAVAYALSKAEGRTSLAFGPPDPRVQPVVTVLPPRPASYETRSPALPSTYDIISTNNGCILRRRTDEFVVALPPSVPCTPYKP